MSVQNPLVSVLMTAFNREDYIAEAIESVLLSTFTDFELIIVDDCSTDETVNIARKYEAKDTRVRLYINESNLGDYPNRNKAASYASGKYLKYVDSDDIISSNGLEVMLSAMEQFPDAGFGFSKRSDDKNICPYSLSGEASLRKHFLGGGFLQSGPSTTIIKTEAFKKNGGFGGARYISDYEAWLNLCLDFSVVVFTNGLMWIRQHEGQEMNLGKLKYYSLNYNLHKKFITATKNPFTEKERKQILYNYKILLGRRVYQRLLRWYGFSKTYQTIKEAGEGWKIFFTAFKPTKK